MDLKFSSGRVLYWLLSFFPTAHNRNPKKPIPAGTETSLDEPFTLSHCTPDLRGSAEVMGKGKGFKRRADPDRVPVPSGTSCAAFGRSRNLSGPQFLHL